MKLAKKLVLYSLLVLGCLAPQLSGAAEATASNEYYTVDESLGLTQAPQNAGSFQEFALFKASQFTEVARAVVLNMLRWVLHEEARPQPQDPYARKLHFGRWINDPYDDTCLNTRALVLVRESETDVTYRNNKNCVVASGKWNDPYSGSDFELAKEIQIDHMVPLKNAYVSGAWQWDYKTRCLYANYMGYKNHLVPSSVRENTSKGDRGPEKFLPSNTTYRCQYLKDWLAIKLIWGLTMAREEAQAIEAVVQEEHCDISDFSMSKSELADQRKTIEGNIDFCLVNKR